MKDLSTITDPALLMEVLFKILKDTQKAGDTDLPSTGVEVEIERWFSSIFVEPSMTLGQKYGTRTSTVLLVDHDNNVKYVERTAEGDAWIESSFEFSPEKL